MCIRDSRHDALERHRHYFRRLSRVEADLHRRELFQSVAEIFDQIARLIVLAARTGEESELGGLSHYQAEFAARNARVRAFFHAERHHRQRLDGGWETG